jgi:hypothetical protein
MKKISFIASLVFLLSAGVCIPASAQKLSGGIEAGFNVSRPTGTDKNKAGFNVGVFGELGLSRGWYLNAALKLTLNPWENNYTYSTSWDGTQSGRDIFVVEKANPYSLVLPIHAGYKFNVANNIQLFAAVGPYVGVGLGGNGKVKAFSGSNANTFESESISNVFGDDGPMRRFQVGFDARIGVEFLKHYIVSVGYDFQFNNMSSISGVKYHGQSFSVNLGYRF